MATTPSGRPPTRLATGFYLWIRKNHLKLIELYTVKRYSIRALSEELEWGKRADIKYALELLNQHEAEVAAGNWKPIEEELFYFIPYYEKLPSIQRVFFELRDPRATGKYTPTKAKKRRPGRRVKSDGAGDGAAKTVDQKDTAGHKNPSAAVTTNTVPATPASVSPDLPQTPKPEPAPLPLSSVPPAPAPSVAPFVPARGPKIVPKSEQLKAVDAARPSNFPSF